MYWNTNSFLCQYIGINYLINLTIKIISQNLKNIQIKKIYIKGAFKMMHLFYYLERKNKYERYI